MLVMWHKVDHLCNVVVLQCNWLWDCDCN